MGEVTIINSNKKRSSNPEHKNNLLLISSVALFLPYDVVVFISLQSTHPHTEPGPGNCWDKFSLKRERELPFSSRETKIHTAHETQPNLEATFLLREGFCTCPGFTLLPPTTQLFLLYFPVQLFPLTMMNQESFFRLFLVFFLLTILMKIGQIP